MRLGYLSLHTYLPYPHGIVGRCCHASKSQFLDELLVAGCWLLVAGCSFLVAHMPPLVRHYPDPNWWPLRAFPVSPYRKDLQTLKCQ